MDLSTRCIAILYIFVLSLPFSQAFSEEHCKKGFITNSGDSTAYMERKGDNRCEGMYEKRVGGASDPELELISLVLGNFHYDLDRHFFLLVSVPENPFGISKRVRIRSIARDEGTNYQLDAFLPNDRPFKWPMRDVLYPEGLQANDIGVYGWVMKDEQRIYIPLSVIPENEQSGHSKKGPAIIVLRTPVDIKNIAWQLKGESEPWPEPQIVYGGTLYRGDWLPMKLPTQNKGLFRLRIKGQKINSDEWVWMDEVRLFIPGQ